MPTIEDMFASVPGTKLDYKIDWKEDAAENWKIDWDTVVGDLPGSAPTNDVMPIIGGIAQVGETLTVTPGEWLGNPAPVLTYQWRVDGVNVIGQTGLTYVVQLADDGFMVDCVETATNSEGFASVTASMGPVIP